MKSIPIIIFLILFCGTINSQSSIQENDVEIFIGSEGYDDSSPVLNFKLTAVSAVWERADLSSFPIGRNFTVTNDFNEVLYSLMPPVMDISRVSSWNGFNIHYSGGNSLFGYGKYKMEVFGENMIVISDAYIYIDWRDFRYPSQSIPYPNYDPYTNAIGPSNDIYIYYIHNLAEETGTFYYSHASNANFTSIPNGGTISIWGVKQISEPPKYMLIEYNDHPFLLWGPNPAISGEPAWVNIKRAINGSIPIVNPATLTYSTTATISNSSPD